MTEKWIEVTWWCNPPRLTHVSVDRFTESSVWVCGERRSRDTTGNKSYYQTFPEAKAEIVRRTRASFDAAKRTLDYHRSKLQEAEAIKEPKP